MYSRLINRAGRVIKPVIVPLPVPDTERTARLALRIADSIRGMELNVFEVNACVRIGLVCMNQGSTLLGAHDHAVKVARRIVFVKNYVERVMNNRIEVAHGN